jgi:membrane-associated phospholipid phosphatase
MSEFSHPHVSGIPDSSRAALRLQAPSDGPAAWIATRLRIFPSLLVSWIVANVGALVIASVMISLGLLTTRVLFSVEAIENADEWLPAWAEDQRTPFRTDLSKIASNLGDVVLIATAGVAIVGLILRRRWRMATFVLQAGLVEALVYLLVANAVERPRPAVEPLDNLNPTHSFPSGLLLTAHFRQRWAGIAIWTVASGIWLAVATSRIYRGEHHPIDVAAGAIMGFCALMAALFAARTARKVAELHATKRLQKARS